MSVITKTVASVVAAAVVGGGVVGVNSYLSDQTDGADASDKLGGVDDVVAVSVAIPKVELPRVTVYTVNTPEVDTVKIIPALELRALNLPKVSDVAGQVGPVRLVGQTIVVPAPGGDIVAVPTPAGYKITVPEVSDPAARMPQLIALQKLQQQLFRDQRNLQYDKSIGLDSESWAEWIKIYKADEPYALQYVPMQKGLRMIAEVKCPDGIDQIKQLDAHLEEYAAAGYNAALVTFDLTEPLYKLRDTIGLVRSKQMSVVIAYTGPENLTDSVFKSPSKLADYLRELGTLADGMLLGWRRTSLHLFLPDRQYINYLCRNARALNSKLWIAGQAYLGETAASNGSELAITYNIPANASGVVLQGIGYPRIATERAIDRMFPETKPLDKLGFVVGERPYFDSLHDTGKSRAENNAIKRQIERRMVYGGCAGTITLHGDGSNGLYGQKGCTDNLCLPYKKIKKQKR